LELPPSLAGVHDVFHVSQLKKCLKTPTGVIVSIVAPLEADLSYPEHPMKLLGQKNRVTMRRTIRLYKVQWSRHSEEGATWETDEFFHSNYPYFHPP
jgi:hypothetical protein